MKRSILSVIMLASDLPPTFGPDVPIDQRKALHVHDRPLPLQMMIVRVHNRDQVTVLDPALSGMTVGRATRSFSEQETAPSAGD